MSAVQLTQDKAKSQVQHLTAIADRLEAEGNADWYAVALAAATIESLRIGVMAVDPMNALCSGVAA